MERYELPDGWEWSTLGESCLVNSRDPALKELPNDTTVSFVPMAAVDAEQGAIANPVDRPFSEVRKGFTPFLDGDVIFAKITPSMENGKAAIARGLKNGFGFGSTEFHVMRPKESVIAEWVFHFVRQQSFRDEAKGSFTGTAGQLRVPEKFILNADIPLAPVPEQQRIVAKIESLFEQSRTARAALTRVPALMSQFRRAVLASATLGRLTEEWREEQGIKEKWSETDIQSVASVSTGSTPLRSNKRFYSGEGTPWITSAATGKPFISSAQEYVTEPAIKAHRLKLFPVGTILVAMYGEGKTRGQVSELAIEATINQACAAIIVDDGKIEKSYLKLVLQANYFEIRELAEGGSQPNLNLTKIKEFTFLLPSLEEQREIVRRIESLFAQADIIEQAASVSLHRAEQVDQSILARAFRGELG
jgi:type I restriction enzyme S subunit